MKQVTEKSVDIGNFLNQHNEKDRVSKIRKLKPTTSTVIE
jgi:hypothetical protein